MSDASTDDVLHADAVEGGNYDVLRARLAAKGEALSGGATTLNTSRESAFGSTKVSIVGNARVRTEHPCVPRDIVSLDGDRLLLAYNVSHGLKKNTKVSDVFSIQRMELDGGEISFHGEPEGGEFLSQATFARHFAELYQYYKSASLLQLRVTESLLLAVFQIGATASDVRVLRWQQDRDRFTYLDNRGERDHVFPPTQDFEWINTTREDHVQGSHPHVNILDTVFVETVGGDLTVKVEDNTTSGEGIYAEPVKDPNQSLDDAEIAYAKRGVLILLRVKPYGESQTRYLIYNTLTRHVLRVDAIGESCVSLPEDHGILFPGGFYLADGAYKVFDADHEDMEFIQSIRAPNGEDVMYIFHRRVDGLYGLYPYNLIRKEVERPIHAHGYCLREDGTLVVFRSDPEATRVHPVQIWATPFVSDEHHQNAAQVPGALGRVGNKELVRGISDALTIVRLVRASTPSRETYEELIGACNRFIDAYIWASEPAFNGLRGLVEEVRQVGELIVDEFEKVVALQVKAKSVLAAAQREHRRVMEETRTERLTTVDAFLTAMSILRRHRGEMITAKDTRYIDGAAIEACVQETSEQFTSVSLAAVHFLEGDAAFDGLHAGLDDLDRDITAVSKAADLAPFEARLETISEGIDLLAEVVAGLDVEDPTRKTAILEKIGQALTHANQVRARLEGRQNSLAESEGKAEFTAQIRLFGHAVQSALARCKTPEDCDDQLSRLGLQLEDLEARFGEFDAFLPDLLAQREDLNSALSSKKNVLTEERNRAIDSRVQTAGRIMESLVRRAATYKAENELNSFFAGDATVEKIRQLADQIEALGDTVKAESLRSKVLSARTEALRALRDNLELFEDGALVRFGKHRFTIHEGRAELTLVPQGDDMALHITGTAFREVVEDPEFLLTRPFWNQPLISESPQLYRGAYLAGLMLEAAKSDREGLSMAALERAVLSEDEMLALVQQFCGERYEEGYSRGIHDHDAAKILATLVGLEQTAGLMRFPVVARVLAQLFWRHVEREEASRLQARARSVIELRQQLGSRLGLEAFEGQLKGVFTDFFKAHAFVPQEVVQQNLSAAVTFLVEVIGSREVRFPIAQGARVLREELTRRLEKGAGVSQFESTLRPLMAHPTEYFGVLCAWLSAVGDDPEHDPHTAMEAAVWMMSESQLSHEVLAVDGQGEVRGLLGTHPTLKDQGLTLRLAAFNACFTDHAERVVPAFRAYQSARRDILEQTRQRLRLNELEPKVMSAFVRNQLINEVYLPLIGDNFAKQLGAAGDNKRTDLMGLLLLVSPPGYGKTTLMEYVAHRLGMMFVKVNGPALGHDVVSLDPSEAPNATARQEVNKVNFALEMGDNVLLYLDDIQHTHPEFLQKFISLCDASRRIEGVWKGRTRTYDLRGRKFAVVMAGNPYTESGDKFQIPDMLANRADTYNLGEVLDGRQGAFAMSFVENALTSNPALQPLASRAQQDVYTLVRMAQGEQLSADELQHDYSAVELSEIRTTLQHLFRCRDVLLKVNETYVRSAAMEDAFRTEPRFQLQGSYRNMAKLTEKIVPAMTEAEVEALITDHYRGESQTLTTGAEFNLLRLGELRGLLTEEESERLSAIREETQRRLMVGGGDDDPVTRVVGALSSLSAEVKSLRDGQELHHLLGQLVTATRDAAPTSDEGLRSALTKASSELSAAVATLQPRPAPWAELIEALKTQPKSVEPVASAPETSTPREINLDVLERGLGHLVEAVSSLKVERPGRTRSEASLAAMERQSVGALLDSVLQLDRNAADRMPAAEYEAFLGRARTILAFALAELSVEVNDKANAT